MACCGGDAVASFAKKREALTDTPFFAQATKKSAAAESGDSNLIDRLAEEAELRKVRAGASLDAVPFGTFVVVVQGELQHTEKRIGGPRPSAPSVNPNADAMASRKAGDFFRMAGLGVMGSSTKLNKMGGAELSRVVAVEPSVVLLITQEALGAALQSAAPGILRDILKEMQSQDLASLIAQVPVFAPLNARMRHTLAQLFSYEVIPPHSTLFEEGQTGETLCVLLHGTLDIYQNDKIVATRVPQAFLGEIALLYDCPRTATIRSGEQIASVLTLRSDHFQKMLDRVPGMRQQIEATQRSRMVYSFMKFAGFYGADDTEEKTKEQCARMAELISVRSVKAGAVLAEGAASPDIKLYGAKPVKNEELFMLYQGSLKRTRTDPAGEEEGNNHGSNGNGNGNGNNGEGGATTETLSPGGYAGGVALLRGDGTTETIVAEVASLVLVASQGAALADLLAEAPSFAAQLMMRSYAKRLPLDAVLNSPTAFAAFQEHQKEEFADESSEFWSASSKYIEKARKASSDAAASAKNENVRTSATDAMLASAQATLRASALDIGSTFIEQGAPKELNLPGAIREATLGALNGGKDLQRGLFDAARKEIFNLMKRDTLPRFVQTERFSTLLAACGEPAPWMDVEPNLPGGANGKEEKGVYSPNYGT